MNGRWLASYDVKGQVERWDLDAPPPIGLSATFNAGVGMSLRAISDDGRWILALDGEKNFRLWFWPIDCDEIARSVALTEEAKRAETLRVDARSASLVSASVASPRKELDFWDNDAPHEFGKVDVWPLKPAGEVGLEQHVTLPGDHYTLPSGPMGGLRQLVVS